MVSVRAAEATRERAVLRLRLAGVALGATLLLLAPEGDRMVAGLALVAYAAGSVLLRYGVPRYARRPLLLAGVVLDLLYASALVSCLPLSEPAWALYAFAVGTAAHRYGAWGAITSTAGAIASYDIVLAVRGSETIASDLWPIQVLIAIGLLCTELVLLAAHNERERDELAVYSLAQHELSNAREVDELLSGLVTHAVLAFGARGAAIRVRDAEGRGSWTHTRGSDVGGEPNVEVKLDERSTFVANVPDDPERGRALVSDLANEARALLATLGERDRQRRALEIDARVGDAIRTITTETDQAAIAAQIVMAANTLGGRGTVIRRGDGALVAGDPLSPDMIERVRDVKAPAIARTADGTRLAIVAAGPGLALVTIASGEVDDVLLRALDTIGMTGGAILARAAERDALEEQRLELRALADRLRDELRARDDAVASTVHELRTPLTSVSAYGQLISRQLQSALQQLAQIDRLIGDLRTDATAGLSLAEVNVVQEVSEAARRQRVLKRANIDVAVAEGGPFIVRADAGRLAQVLDNVLGNAVKFSPEGGHIDISVTRVADDVVIAIADEGPGLAPDDIEHIFERYYRARTTSGRVPGLGIGLAVSREIVQAHGGRITAESRGEGLGSTFRIALPAAATDASALSGAPKNTSA